MITVIIPAYNVENYIEDCLISTLNQTYRNFEIVVIDDGSTDQTGGICDRIAEQNPNMKVIHQEHKGVSAARNIGIKHATGKWIAYIDSDDVLHPQMFEFLRKAVDTAHSKMAFCSFKHISQHEKVNFEDYTFDPSTIEEITIEDEFRRILKVPCYTTIWRGIYSRDSVESIQFIEDLIYEDVPWSFMARGTQERIINIPYALYYYRARANSIVHQKFDFYKFDRFKALDLSLNYLEERSPEVVTGIKIDAFTPIINYQFQIWDEKDPQRRKDYQHLLNQYRKKFDLSVSELLSCKDAKPARKFFFLLCKISFPVTCWIKKYTIKIFENAAQN